MGKLVKERTMKNEPIKHDTAHPAAASAGGDNAYYLKGCDIAQRSPAYASCLFKMAEYDAGRHHEIYRECNAAFGMKQCQAFAMRDEEMLAGQAMYYFPRKPPQALLLPLSVGGDFGVRVTNLTPSHLLPKDPKPKGRFNVSMNKSPLKEHPTAIDRELAETDGYAAAINAAVAALPPGPQKDFLTAPVDMTVEVKRVIAVTASQPVTAPPAPQNAPTARPAMQAGESPLQYARRVAATRNQPQENQ
jgi:hypothetical protein